MMILSKRGGDFIKSFEGLRLTAYRDIVGVLTIGYGHTGSDVIEGMKITLDRANELFDEDVADFVTGVNALAKVKTQGQFDALVSFAYNLGLRSLKKSTLLKKLNDGDIVGASNEFQKWNRAGGKEVAGLTRRRLAEYVVFLG